TDDTGSYLFNGLKPSTYSVETSMNGFAPASAKNFDVLVGQTRTVDLTIRVSGATETVDVIADVSRSQIDMGATSIGASVDLREVHQLPINGRNLSQLYLQAPGAQNTGAGNYGDIRFNGRAVEQNAIRY